ncbi:hypothetical protein BH10ACT1_BH10ACT1_29450 [soil metagenome]
MPDPSDARDGRRAWSGLGLAVGPAAFVTAWAVGGARTPGYSPVHDAISRIAELGAPQRPSMTTGFVAYGAFVLAGVPALRRSAVARTWPAVVVNGLATWAVAALPLGRSDQGDLLHGAAATVGYVSLAAIPALAAGPLARSGRRRAGAASVVAVAAIAACLVATTVADAKGLAQRTGLGIGDIWLATAGLSLAAGRLGRADRPRST